MSKGKVGGNQNQKQLMGVQASMGIDTLDTSKHSLGEMLSAGLLSMVGGVASIIAIHYVRNAAQAFFGVLKGAVSGDTSGDSSSNNRVDPSELPDGVEVDNVLDWIDEAMKETGASAQKDFNLVREHVLSNHEEMTSYGRGLGKLIGQKLKG